MERLCTQSMRVCYIHQNWNACWSDVLHCSLGCPIKGTPSIQVDMATFIKKAEADILWARSITHRTRTTLQYYAPYKEHPAVLRTVQGTPCIIMRPGSNRYIVSNCWMFYVDMAPVLVWILKFSIEKLMLQPTQPRKMQAHQRGMHRM